jgi:hypothetical protein
MIKIVPFAVLAMSAGVAASFACSASEIPVQAKGSTSRFLSPNSKCGRSDKGHTITSVVRLTSTSGAVLDIVAGTLVVERDGDLPDLGGASVTAYDQKCQPVWHQIFPALSEVGLKVLDVVGGPMLRVTAQSGYRFADQQAFVDELFIQIDGTLTPLAPMALGSDRFSRTYIGTIGEDRTFGIVISQKDVNSGRTAARSSSSGRAYLYRWNSYDEAGQIGHAFTGPEVLDSRAVLRLRLPYQSSLPSFPLLAFLLRADNP